MSKKGGLGKGLAELIPVVGPARPGEAVVELPLDLIDPNPFQPRREFDAAGLAELAASIKAQGMLQPVTVRRSGEGRYQLIAGERRLRATRDLGRTVIRAIVREVDDKQLAELSLVENLIRTDLNEIEVAEALAALQRKFGYTVSDLAGALGRSRPAVSNTLRLLELPTPIQEQIRSGALTAGHGRALLAADPAERGMLAQLAAEEGLSVRELERRAMHPQSRMKQPGADGKPAKARKTSKSAAGRRNGEALGRLEALLAEQLGTRVRILSQQSGAGEILLSFYSAEDFERLCELLLRDANPL